MARRRQPCSNPGAPPVHLGGSERAQQHESVRFHSPPPSQGDADRRRTSLGAGRPSTRLTDRWIRSVDRIRSPTWPHEPRQPAQRFGRPRTVRTVHQAHATGEVFASSGTSTCSVRARNARGAASPSWGNIAHLPSDGRTITARSEPLTSASWRRWWPSVTLSYELTAWERAETPLRTPALDCAHLSPRTFSRDRRLRTRRSAG